MPFIVDLASAGLGSALGASAGMAEGQRKDQQTAMQLHQMQQQAAQQQFENAFRVHQAQQAAQQQAQQNAMQQRQLQLEQLKQQQQQTLQYQQLTGANTRNDANNQVKLTIANINDENARDRLVQNDQQFQAKFGITKAQFDLNTKAQAAKIAQGDAQAQALEDWRQKNIQQGYDRMTVERAYHQALIKLQQQKPPPTPYGNLSFDPSAGAAPPPGGMGSGGGPMPGSAQPATTAPAPQVATPPKDPIVLPPVPNAPVLAPAQKRVAGQAPPDALSSVVERPNLSNGMINADGVIAGLDKLKAQGFTKAPNGMSLDAAKADMTQLRESQRRALLREELSDYDLRVLVKAYGTPQAVYDMVLKRKPVK